MFLQAGKRQDAMSESHNPELLNYSPAQTYPAFIDHYRLSGCHRPLRLGEFAVAAGSIDARDGARRIFLSIARFGAIDPIAMRHSAADPVQIGGGERILRHPAVAV